MSARAQILVALVILGTIIFLFRLLRRGQLRSKYVLLWTVIAIGLLPLAVVPDILVPISDAVGIDYEPATVLFASTAFLFLIVVHFSWEISRLEDRTRTLAEEVALLRAELPSASEAPDPV
jgi:hypothetical protein